MSILSTQATDAPLTVKGKSSPKNLSDWPKNILKLMNHNHFFVTFFLIELLA